MDFMTSTSLLIDVHYRFVPKDIVRKTTPTGDVLTSIFRGPSFPTANIRPPDKNGVLKYVDLPVRLPNLQRKGD